VLNSKHRVVSDHKIVPVSFALLAMVFEIAFAYSMGLCWLLSTSPIRSQGSRQVESGTRNPVQSHPVYTTVPTYPQSIRCVARSFHLPTTITTARCGIATTFKLQNERLSYPKTAS
jgi:hypothetical protein